MPSLRKRVSTYLRQLSFHNEPRDKRNNVNENAFVTKYLQGQITLREGPPIIYGKIPTDLPNYELGKYDSGASTIVGCYSGPNGGLTTVKRIEKHLSVPDDDIDFIDNPDEDETSEKPKLVNIKKSEILSVPQQKPKKSPQRVSGQPIDNTTMVIKVAGNEYCVTNKPKRHSKSYSLGSISDFNIEVEKTKIEKDFYNCDSKRDENSNDNHTKCSDKNGLQIKNCEGTKKSDGRSITTNINNTKAEPLKKELREESNEKTTTKQKSHRISTNTSVLKHQSVLAEGPRSCSTKPKIEPNKSNASAASKSYSLSKSRSEGHPFHNRKRGRIIQVQRPQSQRGDDSLTTENVDAILPVDDTTLPTEWNLKSDCYYGVSDSLYDRNQVTKHKNGDPIADCFGVLARNDSAILAVADGVNWGEKASIAAKSAVHASLHYLNKTIFNDTKPFEKLTTKTDDQTGSSDTLNPDESTNLIANTREVFVCLLRAFNCAHDLILENKGMLTTLTVAVVLPLKQRIQQTTENGVRSRHHHEPHYVCCVCNVGDTLAYIYSQRNGIRELTKGSHDVNSNRDMRDALGALGPVDGINPELSNLTLSITTLSKGDIVMVASDGLTDNFDPNVCKFTVNSHIDPAKSRAKKTSSGVLASQSHTIHAATSHHQSHIRTEESMVQKPPIKPPRRSKNRGGSISSASQSERSTSSVEKESSSSNQPPLSGDKVDEINPLAAHFVRENSLDESTKHAKGEAKKPPPVIENKASSLRKQASSQIRQDSDRKITPRTLDTSRGGGVGYTFLKSKTSLDLRPSHYSTKIQILRNDDGIPYITPIQRYELQLLLMEDILKHGISGRDNSITTAKKLCESLVSFTMSITSAKRRTLEDQDMYFDNRNGVLVEVSNQEKKLRRKRGLERVQSLPGKLDHVTVVAYNVGNVAF